MRSNLLRMVMAEPEEEETVTAKHVAAAVKNCSSLNNSGNYWATVDIVPTKHGQVVHMEVGNIHSDTFKERANQTFTYMLDENGEVHVSKHTHP